MGDKLGGGSYTRQGHEEEEEEENDGDGETNTEETGLKKTWSNSEDEDDGMIDVGMNNNGHVENGDYESSPLNISKNDHDVVNMDNAEIVYENDESECEEEKVKKNNE